MNTDNREAARAAYRASLPHIQGECRQVWGGELHYQALIYHCLRQYGQVPLDRLGMNVKIWIENPVSTLFKQKDLRKHEDFRGGFEPIPDIAIFSGAIQGDWRRRNNHKTLEHLLYSIEVKASERKDNRLTYKELRDDVDKQIALREEVKHRHRRDLGIAVLVIDTAEKAEERMKTSALADILAYAKAQSCVDFAYFSLQENYEVWAAG